MTYHVTFFDLSNNHVTSHMINPNTRLPTLAFPLWNTDTITTLGRLPNWDVESTSYLGNTPIWKLQNQDNWKTRWPDRDRFSLELAKSTQLLTQTISHPALQHLIESPLSGFMLSPHRHWDRPLMSLHLCLQPPHVGSESKNNVSEPDDLSTSTRALGALAIVATRSHTVAQKTVPMFGCFWKIELE